MPKWLAESPGSAHEVKMKRAWWNQLFEGRATDEAEALRELLARIHRKETVLAFHLADRARAMRFPPHRMNLEGMAERERQNADALACEIEDGATLAPTAAPPRRCGTLTATKLIQDLAETEDLYTLYRQARWLTPDEGLRDKLAARAAEEDRSSRTIRRIVGAIDTYVTDRA